MAASAAGAPTTGSRPTADRSTSQRRLAHNRGGLLAHEGVKRRDPQGAALVVGAPGRSSGIRRGTLLEPPRGHPPQTQSSQSSATARPSSETSSGLPPVAWCVRHLPTRAGKNARTRRRASAGRRPPARAARARPTRWRARTGQTARRQRGLRPMPGARSSTGRARPSGPAKIASRSASDLRVGQADPMRLGLRARRHRASLARAGAAQSILVGLADGRRGAVARAARRSGPRGSPR
jgi:hypothetical protein